MIDNMVCTDADVDYLHFVDTCRAQGLALDQCQAAADAG